MHHKSEKDVLSSHTTSSSISNDSGALGAFDSPPNFDDTFNGSNSTPITVPSDGDFLTGTKKGSSLNRAPHFVTERAMPFISVFFSKGFFCFPSEDSLEVYMENNRKLNLVDPEDGLGLPLFRASPSWMKTTFAQGRTGIMKIYKYTFVDSRKQSTPTLDAKLVCKLNDHISIYQYKFCTIFKCVEKAWSRKVEHVFVYHTNPLAQSPKKEFELSLFRYRRRNNSDLSYNGLNLRWYGSVGPYLPFDCRDIKLTVLDDNMTTYMDHDTIKEFDKHNKTENYRDKKCMPIWAMYTDDYNSMFWKKHVYRVATFYVKESELPTYQSAIHSSPTSRANTNTESELTTSTNLSATDGLDSVPWDTQVITCMGMLLHYYKVRNEGSGGGGGPVSHEVQD